MIEGWILDTHLDYENERMILWLKHDDGAVSKHSFQWQFKIHVRGEKAHLNSLKNSLQLPEYQIPFGGLEISFEKHRLAHESEEKQAVLAVGISRPSNVRKVAEMISGNGAWKNFELFSVDPKITQRFLLDLGTFPFGRVRIEGNKNSSEENSTLTPLDARNDGNWVLPSLSQVRLHVECRDKHGKRRTGTPIISISITSGVNLGDPRGNYVESEAGESVGSESEAGESAAGESEGSESEAGESAAGESAAGESEGSESAAKIEENISKKCGKIYTFNRDDFETETDFLKSFESCFNRLDPDVVYTENGDAIDFPALYQLAEESGSSLCLSRTNHQGSPRRKARTSWSYGRLLRSDAYHAFEGRLHIDIANSFITKEGGLEGLLELSRVSGLPAQDLSRLSPGSAISAMQIQQSMEDGVLIPWKKNRPEDMKTGTQILLADRGGLYLDPRVGVHKGVIELDFASLFPSIIATKNISPETMNCECCAPYSSQFENEKTPPSVENERWGLSSESEYDSRRDGRLPLATNLAAAEIERRLQSNENHKLIVPELGLHVCTRRHGFLGRVVAPIIERRNILKSKRKVKGDVWDRRQNVLKWILVCCFGYTGYRNARFGRIECHEAICAWSRDILLESIDEAENEGWECLHAIVDAIWLVDIESRSENERLESIERLMERIELRVGIPLDLEEIYDWIAFIPNRTTGTGALTKYFAHGREGWKVRGIELRQHSTCNWVRLLQENVLNLMRDNSFENAPLLAIDYLHEQLLLLRSGEIPLCDLVVSRRVRSEVGTHRVLNLTAAALLREQSFGQRTPPGRKVHFAVTGWRRKVASQRLRMKSEIESNSDSVIGESGDYEFYEPLAVRAVSALLSPLGWTEDRIRSGRSVQTSLVAWI